MEARQRRATLTLTNRADSSSSSSVMSTILDLPAAILEVIFLRLDAAADVVRASAACKSHRSVVCNRRFLRRYRSLHPPPVLGFLESMGTGGGILHAQTPHQSAPAASVLVQAADFTFSFLPTEPSTFPWQICDAHHGRVLLSRRSADDSATFLDLVICDPLYRRYVQIPSVPEDLWDKRYSTEMESEPFLLPAREEEDESRFRVIYNWVSTYKIITFLFDSGISGTEKWTVATTFNFLPDRLIHEPMRLVRHRHYVGSCFYWVRRQVLKHMLVLDPLEMKFSITGLPSGTVMEWGPKVQAVFDAGMNRLGMAVLGGPARNLDLYSKTWQDNCGSAEKWQLDKHHQLPEAFTHHYISGAAEGYLLLAGHCDTETVQYFILDLKTFQVERFCNSSMDAVYEALPYARFPPSLLSPPSI